MAHLAQDPKLSDRIDNYLAYLIRKWENIPALADEWSQWDEHSKLVFTVDWGVPADRLYQVQQWAEEDVLTTAQRRRFKKLMRLVADYRSTLERLLKD